MSPFSAVWRSNAQSGRVGLKSKVVDRLKGYRLM
jgi:hypothetical protein